MNSLRIISHPSDPKKLSEIRNILASSPYSHVRQIATDMLIKGRRTITLKKMILEALNELSNLIKCWYQHHFSVAEEAWHAIHALYRLAKLYHIESLEIENCYKSILLLSISDCYRFHSDQIDLVESFIDMIAPLAVLESDISTPADYVIDCSRDTGPMYAKTFHETSQQECLSMDISSILLSLYLQQELLAKQQQPQTLPLACVAMDEGLLNEMMSSWRHQTNRSEKRIPIELPASVSIAGLSQIKNELCGWQVTNVSSHGCGLCSERGVPSHIEPGQAIWLMYDNHEHVTEHLGKIAWVRYSNYGGVSLGVEYTDMTHAMRADDIRYGELADMLTDEERHILNQP